MLKNTLAVLCVLCLPAAAQATSPDYEESDAVKMGSGSFKAYGIVKRGVPQEFGITFTEDVFTGAPTAESDGSYDIYDGDTLVWPCCGHEHEPDVPSNIAKVTAFDHIVLNWNPKGHPPNPPAPPIYRPPHIDFHFYTLSSSTRVDDIATPEDADAMCTPGIPLTCDDFATATAALPSDQLVADYLNLGAVEPAMGNHLLWSGAPELQPPGSEGAHGFTHTWIYGTWDGDLVFWEPMITQAYLTGEVDSKNVARSNADASFRDCFDVPSTPDAAPEAGYYPTSYCVKNTGGKKGRIKVYLTDFVWLGASTDD